MKMSADTQDAFREKVLTAERLVEDRRSGARRPRAPRRASGRRSSARGATCRRRLRGAAEAFKDFYLKQHSGRKLTWQTNMGNADIKASFRARRHEINVSTHQMCILLLFNGCDAMSYAEIAADTQIPPAELKRALQSLACAKYKILNKEPKGRDVDDGDAFHYNADFSAKQLRFKVGTVSATKETEVEKAETRQKVDEDRKPQIEVSLLPTICEVSLESHSPSSPPQAAIVRIMKSRKEMDHNALIAEVTTQLQARFHANPNAIRSGSSRSSSASSSSATSGGASTSTWRDRAARRVSVSASQCDSR